MKNTFASVCMPVTHSITGALAKVCAAEVGRATPCAPFPEIQTPIPIKHMTEKSTARHYICQVCAQGFTVPKPQQWPHVCPTCCPEGNAPCVVAPAVESVPAWAFHPTSMPVRDQVCLPELLSLLARVAAFQNKAFPNQTLAGKLKHLVKEAGELRDCNGMEREEWADVLLLLLGAAALEGHTFADLVRFAHEKLTINEGRTWLPADADGCYHHVKEGK